MHCLFIDDANNRKGSNCKMNNRVPFVLVLSQYYRQNSVSNKGEMRTIYALDSTILRFIKYPHTQDFLCGKIISLGDIVVLEFKFTVLY